MGLATRAVILLSGGLDSTVLLYHLLAEWAEVRALSVDYGQRHRRELEAARMIAGRVGVEHRVADISAVTGLLGGSALTSADIDVPLGHYEDETMKATIVPNRNMILLALATAWAIATQSDMVGYAAHAGDHAIYPDCRAEFADAMASAISLCDWHAVTLARPFVGMTKAEIVRRGAELGLTNSGCSTTLVIGDSLKREIPFGNQIGATTIYIPAGFMGAEQPTVAAEKPDYSLSSLGELPALLLDLNFI